ncbi:MAG: hypothetical protein GX376_07645 [Firmicutes bacterium]|nr:hypothetical protein [Bacillota bacterium]
MSEYVYAEGFFYFGAKYVKVYDIEMLWAVGLGVDRVMCHLKMWGQVDWVTGSIAKRGLVTVL